MPGCAHAFRVQAGHGDQNTVFLKCLKCEKPVQFTAADWARMVAEGTVETTFATIP